MISQLAAGFFYLLDSGAKSNVIITETVLKTTICGRIESRSSERRINMKNIIYCFTGTGNSLHAAQKIAAAMEDCEVIPVTTVLTRPGKCDSIGFVYPVYFQGLPLIVREFISRLDLTRNRDTYYYAVATYGGAAGNGLSQLDLLLGGKGLKLNFGVRLLMFSNYVVWYDMKKNVADHTRKSDQALLAIIPRITGRETNTTGKPKPLLERYYQMRKKSIPQMASGYHLSGACTSCGLCAYVCPVGNIRMDGKAPQFGQRCEQCMACIQYCPKKAINYRQKTAKRGRYNHPAISPGQLAGFYKGPE